MILDLAYTSRDLYISNQVKSRPTYLSDLGFIGLHIRVFCYLVNVLTFIQSVYWQNNYTDKADVCIREKS